MSIVKYTNSKSFFASDGPIMVTGEITTLFDFNENDTSGLISIDNIGEHPVILSGENISLGPDITSITIPAKSASIISFANAHTLTLASTSKSIVTYDLGALSFTREQASPPIPPKPLVTRPKRILEPSTIINTTALYDWTVVTSNQKIKLNL